jgi:hypothetical protein
MSNPFRPLDPELIAAKTPFDIVSFLRAGGIADNSPEAVAIETLLDLTCLEESQQQKTAQDRAKERAFISTNKLSQHLQDLVEWQAKQILQVL